MAVPSVISARPFCLVRRLNPIISPPSGHDHSWSPRTMRLPAPLTPSLSPRLSSLHLPLASRSTLWYKPVTHSQPTVTARISGRASARGRSVGRAFIQIPAPDPQSPLSKDCLTPPVCDLICRRNVIEWRALGRGQVAGERLRGDKSGSVRSTGEGCGEARRP